MKLHSIFGALLLALSTLLSACAGQTEPERKDDGHDRQVTLVLELCVGQISGSEESTRFRFDEDEDGKHEQAADAAAAERLQTLRVIIVRDTGRGDYIVEHNRSVAVREVDDPETGETVVQIVNDNLEFLVRAAENKIIYLIGNERKINDDFFNSYGEYPFELVPGSLLPSLSALEKITYSRAPGEAWIDNLKDNDESYIPMTVPMTEVFSVYVPDPVNVIDLKYTEKLFLMRTPIKFSFNFTTQGDYTTDLSVEQVKIDGIADTGYIFPFNTKYSPDGKHFVVSFETPATEFSPITFNVPYSEGNRIRPGMNFNYSPHLYVPETKASSDNPVKITVKLSGGENFLDPVPLDLNEIPRNTHVKINIVLKGTSLSATAVLEPYVGVTLDPIFGIERPEEEDANNNEE